MKRRNFLTLVSTGSGGVLLATRSLVNSAELNTLEKNNKNVLNQLSADVVVAGGGLGGCASAIAACRNGLKVIMTEETDWIGGQISQQGVPPDEHSWIESHGAPASYREYRDRVRAYYKLNYPMTEDAKKRKNLNPGDGSVSRICHEPRVAVAVLTDMLAPYVSSGKLKILTEHKIRKADVEGDHVKAVEAINLKNGNSMLLTAPYFVDATECGDLLPLTRTEYVTGTESKKETGELHAPEVGNPKNNQAFTMCFAMDYQPGVNNVIDRPKDYSFWNSYVPKMNQSWAGKLFELNYSNPKDLTPKNLGFHPAGIRTGDMLNLWLYRRIINKNNFISGTYDGDITIVNWPQNDYFPGNLIDVNEKEFNKHVDAAKQLSLSFFYWLQTEAPRPDGGTGWPGLRLRGDVMGTNDGLAKYPYIRESRRIRAMFTILEEHVGVENRRLVAGEDAGKKAADFYDSVGVGYYHIDLHPSCEGDNYIDFRSMPFQIPLGALIPQRMNNLFPANKNIGTTHITNGCYRLHPVEWSIGEAVGSLIAFANNKKVEPRAVREHNDLLNEFQNWIRKQGIETHWPA
jgi:hypothetical protein